MELSTRERTRTEPAHVPLLNLERRDKHDTKPCTPALTILAATDFSVDGNNAVRRAALLAHEHQAHLHVVHALKAAGFKALREWFAPTIDTDFKAAQARAALCRVAAEITGAYDLSASVEVVLGDLFSALRRASARATLVVLGQRSCNGFESVLVRRTAERMIRTCRRPVLVVKNAPHRPYRRVLMPVDFTASSDNTVRFASPLLPTAHVHVLHATDTHQESVLRRSDVDETVIREVRAREIARTSTRMRRTVGRLGLDCMRTSFAVARGPADQATLQRAIAHGSDLIVVGRQGRSTISEFLLGSVSSRVLAASGCDVLIVPSPRMGQPAQHEGQTRARMTPGRVPAAEL